MHDGSTATNGFLQELSAAMASYLALPSSYCYVTYVNTYGHGTLSLKSIQSREYKAELCRLQATSARATMVQLIPYLVLASTVLALPPLGYERKLFHEKLARSSYNTSESCLTDAAPTTKAPKSNIWAQIAAEDNLAVWNLLHDPASNLNLTHPSKAVPSDNYV